MKKVIKLLATASDEKNIIKLISEFYYGATISLKSVGNKIYKVNNLNGLIGGVRVVKKGKRFRFEQVEK